MYHVYHRSFFPAGWPPALRGKKWFTFHERPLQPSSRAALETLQRSGALSTLYAAVAYLQLEEGWETWKIEVASGKVT